MTKLVTDQVRRFGIGRVRRARTRAKIAAAAFDMVGDENGLHAHIEAVAKRTDITRATFYDHFTGMPELLEAATYDVTHDFLTAVTRTISRLSDPRE